MHEINMQLAKALQQVQQLLLLKKFVKKIAEMTIADEDSDDETTELIIFKGLIIEARDLLDTEANFPTENKLEKENVDDINI